jgi:hypothetical protein
MSLIFLKKLESDKIEILLTNANGYKNDWHWMPK